MKDEGAPRKQWFTAVRDLYASGGCTTLRDTTYFFSSQSISTASIAQSNQRAAPVVVGVPALSEAGADGFWTAGETVEVQLTFSEPVSVETAGGTPSIGLRLGAQAQSAAYASGSGTVELVFGYTLADDEGPYSAILVTGESLALNGGAIVSTADSTVDADLAHDGAGEVGLPALPASARATRGVADGSTASFSDLPAAHDGEKPFKVKLSFSEKLELSYKTVRDSLLEVSCATESCGTVTGVSRVTKGSDRKWWVTVKPSQAYGITLTLREGRGRSLSGTDHREVARYWAGLPLLVRLSEAGTELSSGEVGALLGTRSVKGIGAALSGTRDTLFAAGIRMDEAAIRRTVRGRSVWTGGPRIRQAIHVLEQERYLWKESGGRDDVPIEDARPEDPGPVLVLRALKSRGNVYRIDGGMAELDEILEDGRFEIGDARRESIREIFVARIEPGRDGREHRVPDGYGENGIWVPLPPWICECISGKKIVLVLDWLRGHAGARSCSGARGSPPDTQRVCMEPQIFLRWRSRTRSETAPCHSRTYSRTCCKLRPTRSLQTDAYRILFNNKMG